MRKWIKKHKKIVVVIAVLLVLGVPSSLILPRFFKSNSRATEMKKQENTIELSKMDLTTSISATGTLESAESTTVSANVSDIEIKKVKVAEGDTVKKGDVLVTFDESDLKEALADAKENLSEAKEDAADDLEDAKEKLADAKETYSEDKEDLKDDVAKAKKAYLAAKKAVKTAKTSEEKTKAKQTLSEAKSAYESAKEKQESTNEQNQEAIESAEDALD
ncbi:MAG: biotin/lipoyl-binding protein, partial [Eubacterium sp.]|nr:biotin/lipoyl-binding protein [Eubacterium sp.]